MLPVRVIGAVCSPRGLGLIVGTTLLLIIYRLYGVWREEGCRELKFLTFCGSISFRSSSKMCLFFSRLFHDVLTFSTGRNSCSYLEIK